MRNKVALKANVICMSVITLCFECYSQNSGQHVTMPVEKNRLVTIYAGLSSGPQFVQRIDNLTEIKLSPKYSAGVSLEFNSDYFRKKVPVKASIIFEYDLFGSYENIRFTSYFDTSGRTSFQHEIDLFRLAPSQKIKVKFNTLKHAPFIAVGFVARDLPFKRAIVVSEFGNVYFSKGNFDNRPPGLLAVNALIMGVPGVGPLLLNTYPEIDFGMSFGTKQNINIGIGVSFYDYMNISSAYWNYTSYRPDVDDGATIVRSQIHVLFKYKLL